MMDTKRAKSSAIQKKRKDKAFLKNKYKNPKEHGSKHFKDKGLATLKQNRVKYDYMKLLKKERQQGDKISRQPQIPTLSTTNSSESEDYNPGSHGNPDKHHRKKTKTRQEDQSKQHMYSQAQNRFKLKKDAKEKHRQDVLHKMEGQKQAMDKYHDRKKKRHLMLCKKTNRGQPVMRHQINYLLEKIKEQAG